MKIKSLEDDSLLDQTKWIKQGNLLRKMLTKVKNQIMNERQTHSQHTNSPHPNYPNLFHPETTEAITNLGSTPPTGTAESIYLS